MIHLSLASSVREALWQEDDLLIVQVRWQNHLLAEDLLIGRKAGRFYIPLRSFVQALEFPLVVDLEQSSFRGWMVDEMLQVSCDLNHGLLTLGEQERRLAFQDMVWFEGDLYAETQWLSTWMPLDLEIDEYQSVIQVLPRVPLPLQRRLERLARRAAHQQSPTTQPVVIPHQKEPYRLADWPLLDLSLNSQFKEATDAPFQSNVTVSGVGDLGWMTGEFLASRSTPGGADDGLDVGYLQLSRKDSGAGLLGPLGATEVYVGDILSPAGTFAGRSMRGLGFSFSNMPLQQPQSFEKIDLEGPLLPGWEVELYRDGALVDFRVSNGAHRYLFRDIPLYFGHNRFHLKFFGPQGQERSVIRDVQIDSGLRQPGKTYYHVAVNRLDERLLPSLEAGTSPKLRTFVALEQGMNRHLTWKARLTRLFLEDAWHLFSGGGFRAAYRDHSLTGNLVHNGASGTVLELQATSLLGRQRIQARHMKSRKFRSDIISKRGLIQSSLVRVSGPLFRNKKHRVNHRFNLQEDRFLGQKREWQISNQISLFHSRFSLSHSLNWFHRDRPEVDPSRGLSGRFITNLRWFGLTVRLRAGYHLSPRLSFRDLALDASTQLGTRSRMRGQVWQDFNSHTRVKGSFTRVFAKFLASVELGYNSRAGYSASLSLGTQLMRNPVSHDWQFEAEGTLRSPVGMARAFIDANQNGQFDRNEQPIVEVGFALNGIKLKGKTNVRGEIRIPGLPLHQRFDLTVDRESVEDPFLVPVPSEKGGMVRPGRVPVFDFPFVATSEIEGLVVRELELGLRGVAGVTVRLWNEQGRKIAETRTEYDGVFLFERVTPGEYSLDLAPTPFVNSDLKVPQAIRFTVISGELFQCKPMVLQE